MRSPTVATQVIISVASKKSVVLKFEVQTSSVLENTRKIYFEKQKKKEENISLLNYIRNLYTIGTNHYFVYSSVQIIFLIEFSLID